MKALATSTPTSSKHQHMIQTVRSLQLIHCLQYLILNHPQKDADTTLLASQAIQPATHPSRQHLQQASPPFNPMPAFLPQQSHQISQQLLEEEFKREQAHREELHELELQELRARLRKREAAADERAPPPPPPPNCHPLDWPSLMGIARLHSQVRNSHLLITS